MSTDYITSEPAVDFPLEDDYAFPVSTEPDTSTIKSHSKTLMFLQIIIGVLFHSGATPGLLLLMR